MNSELSRIQEICRAICHEGTPKEDIIEGVGQIATISACMTLRTHESYKKGHGRELLRMANLAKKAGEVC